jgi:hypothetical protein
VDGPGTGLQKAEESILAKRQLVLSSLIVSVLPNDR